jgi:inosine-uridine nucleoside N-ribohydrolase
VPQKLIIDTDPGIGDALALTLALLDPEVDLVGITPTAGCVGGHEASHNVQAIVGWLDPPKWPRMGWAEGPPTTSPASGRPNPLILNGRTGLGDFESPVAEPHQRHESAKLLIDLVRTYPHELTLLTLGPLTNLELAQERHPPLLSELKGLVVLGGAMTHCGDATATAEFNIYSDPEAARSILTSPVSKTIVPLDVTAPAVLSYSQFDRLSVENHSQLARLLEQTLPFAFRAYHEHLGIEGFPMAEVVALAAVTSPQMFQRKSLAVDVETHGELTRGTTVFDRRRHSPPPPNADVLTEVDPQSVFDFLGRSLRRAVS